MITSLTTLFRRNDSAALQRAESGAKGSITPSLDLTAESRGFWDKLVELRLFSTSRADRFLESRRGQLANLTTASALGNALVQENLLTSYQVERVHALSRYYEGQPRS